MLDVLTDLRAGARALRRTPGLAVAAVLTLAAGIAACTVLFSLVRGLLASPLPFHEPERLVRVLSERGGETGKLSLLEIDDLNREARSFEGFASFRNTQYTITGDGPPEAVPAAINTYNLFEVLGVRPYLGQTWPAAHDRSRVFEVVLGFDVWRRRFGGDPAIVGRQVTLDAAPYTVLGVLPPGFDFPLGAGIYRRTPPGDYDSRAIREAGAVARLKSGVTLAQAREELAEIARRWERLHPKTNAGLRLVTVPLREQWIGGARPYLLALLGAVALVQLIACANVAGLLLTRAVARRRELAVRAALGAGRGRLIRQLLAESLLLALAGGALGLLLAATTVGLWRHALPLALPSWMTIEIDGGVVAFTFAAALASALAAGLVPALQAAHTAPGETLQEAGRAGAGGRRQQRLRRLLVGAEVALAVVLTAGAGLMARSLVALSRIDPGFDPEHVLTLRIDPPWSRFNEVGQTAPFYRRLLAEIAALPGVEVAAASDAPPLADQDQREGANRQTFVLPGQPEADRERNPYLGVQRVSAGALAALRLPLLRGRGFDDGDRLDTSLVALVSESAAARLWPGRDPLGQRLRLAPRGANYRPLAALQASPGAAEAEPWLTVIGVVGDVRQGSLTGQRGLDVYLSDQQHFVPETYLLVRTRQEPEAMAEAVRRAVWRVDPDQAVFDVQPMARRIAGSIWQQRLSGLLFVLFAGLALGLAGLGIYGVVAIAVAQGRREIGMRMALGARPSDVVREVLVDTLALVLAGVAAGGLAALALGRLLAALLYGVSAADPLTFAAVPVVLAGVALAAALLPAWRAARVAPSVVLREGG